VGAMRVNGFEIELESLDSRLGSEPRLVHSRTNRDEEHSGFISCLPWLLGCQ
jgi:hypothetical protein